MSESERPTPSAPADQITALADEARVAGELPLDQQADRFQQIHEQLQTALAAIDGI